MKIYFICTEARSGCTYFLRLIRSVHALGWPETALDEGQTKVMTESQIQQQHQQGLPFGMKLPQPPREEVLGWFEPDLLIHYYRRDLVGQGISYLRARESDTWVQSAIHTPPDTSRLQYRFTAICRTCQVLRNRHQRITELHPHTNFIYEEVCQDPAGQIRRLGRLLGVPIPAGVAPTTGTLVQRDGLTEEWHERFCKELREQAKGKKAKLLQLLEPQDYT